MIDWPFWYQYGSPGPTWGCDAGTTPQLENEPAPTQHAQQQCSGALQHPAATSYSCKTLSGELTWNAGLEDADGQRHDLHRRQRENREDVGRAGARALRGPGHDLPVRAHSCSRTRRSAQSSAGTTATWRPNVWDPNVAALIIVAKSKGTSPGTQATAGNNSVEVKSSQFQGVLSGEYDILSEDDLRGSRADHQLPGRPQHQPDLRRLVPRHPLRSLRVRRAIRRRRASCSRRATSAGWLSWTSVRSSPTVLCRFGLAWS